MPTIIADKYISDVWSSDDDLDIFIFTYLSDHSKNWARTNPAAYRKNTLKEHQFHKIACGMRGSVNPYHRNPVRKQKARVVHIRKVVTKRGIVLRQDNNVPCWFILNTVDWTSVGRDSYLNSPLNGFKKVAWPFRLATLVNPLNSKRFLESDSEKQNIMLNGQVWNKYFSLLISFNPKYC